ncbi:uncharacterized membrane protein YsdA (DUF1294 family) [Methanocalculus alkaliphilus]|uniref:DUF1294 domain-containing protein n=1 Tax=Methanocalculus alkaliphilus TaxID=768730 RepID=UPI0020A21B93|nr:DUF1294 domain-containing protein [Methanocalculus alkaliphilus]MCP1714656.1 uncharacterized membrane protein YsdA (DUF1294 family) [Methanocalculus alkaliphilus]
MTVPLPQDLLIHGALYLILNIFSFLTFADDKANAKSNQWRTSEKRLLIYAMIGPLGAMAAMKLLRHKTQKIKFKLVYLFLAVHILLIGYYLLPFLQVIRI